MSGYKKTLSIFIDVLGTKDRTDFSKKKLIHDIFHSEVAMVEEREKNTVSNRRLNRKVFSFSDCAYILYQFKDEKNELEAMDIDALFQGVKNILIPVWKIMNAGFFIRGGASFGDGYYDDLGCFGPSLESAYLLECSKDGAVNPTILLENDLGNMLFDYEQKIREEIDLNKYTSPRPFILMNNDKYYANLFYGIKGMQFGIDGKSFIDTVRSSAEENKAKVPEAAKKMDWILETIQNELTKTDMAPQITEAEFIRKVIELKKRDQ